MIKANHFRAVTLVTALAAALLVLAGALLTLAETKPAEAAVTAQTWDLSEDFRVDPNHANPSPDRQGNADVWHYMRSSGQARDAATYSLLKSYGVPKTLSDIEGWLTIAEKNPYDIPFLVKRSSDGQMLVHPTSSLDTTGTFPDSNSVVGWKSPMTGKISISGEVRDGHVGCCDGVDWYVHRDSGESLASGEIQVGGAEGLSRQSLTDISVDKGEFIYLVVHPHATAYQDTTEIDLSISGTPADTDEDEIIDDEDNCSEAPNPDQADLDGDDIGDACDSDLDGDKAANNSDNCPNTSNPGQEDSDQDGVGDACETNLPGRMSGDGIVTKSDGEKIAHGFKLHCDATKEPNTLQVNWSGNIFELEELTKALCGDNENIDNSRKALFDTLTGEGIGKLNGQTGAKIKWTLVDAGEPGSKDTVRITIMDSENKTVLDVSETLDEGNQKAHHEKP